MSLQRAEHPPWTRGASCRPPMSKRRTTRPRPPPHGCKRVRDSRDAHLLRPSTAGAQTRERRGQVGGGKGVEIESDWLDHQLTFNHSQDPFGTTLEALEYRSYPLHPSPCQSQSSPSFSHLDSIATRTTSSKQHSRTLQSSGRRRAVQQAN